MDDTAKLLVAIATANGHPNPEEWAAQVAAHMAPQPAASEPALTADQVTAQPEGGA